ncbi:MAG: corrinoid protein [Clostridiales bacterium]|nr:corrinoid protein [Clostridiales bacterium]MCF8023546.1 corrinoid protein [Clostridiales bacterium]
MKRFNEKVMNGDAEGIKDLIQEELDKGTAPQRIINEGLIAPMDEIGEKWKTGDMFMPEVIMAAQTMKAGLEVVKPILGENMETKGVILMGTVAGDLHDIGKNLVKMLLESAGYEVIDAGVDVSTETFMKEIEKQKPNIVGLSALLTTTMKSMEETVRAINEKYDDIHTIIGGAPVDQAFADKIGAKGYASDAGGAIEICDKLISA